ncbi:MAG: aminotransferase class V-fold PLP-dependent enzyme [Pseudomonadota bacterium]
MLEPGLIHLNTASAGPAPKAIFEACAQAWRTLESDPVVQSYFDSPNTIFTLADRVRAEAAALIGCAADEILFTRGTTDAITTIANSLRLERGDRVLLGNLEHEGGEVGWLHRQRLDGIGIDRVQLPLTEHDPRRILDIYAAAIGPRTRVISVSHVLAPTGLKMPVAEITALARANNIFCVVDGAQAVGQMPVDVRAIGCDAYATSGHKWLMGPKGTGLLYIASDSASRIDVAPWQLSRKVGANSAGLAPLVQAVGLSRAIASARQIGIERIERHNLSLARRVYEGFSAISGLGLVSAAPGPVSTAMVTAELPAGLDSKTLRERMRARHRIIIKSAEPRWMNGIRLSPHLFNNRTEVDLALDALKKEISGWTG